MKKILISRSIKFDFTNIKRNLSFIIFALLIAMRIVLGLVCYNNLTFVRTEAESLFNAHYELHTKTSFFSLAGQTLLNILPIAVSAFIIGTSALGCALVPLIPSGLGFAFGIISGCLYDKQEIMGVVFNLLIFLPPALIAFFALLLCCRESFGFSRLLATMCIKGGKCFNLYLDFKNYCTRYIVIFILFIIYALIDASLTLFFIRFFKF